MKSKIFILFFCLMSLSKADIVEIRDGRKHNGIILESTSQYVKLQINDFTIINLFQKDIESIVFTYADVIHFITGESVKCKILEEIYPKLKVITSDGVKYYNYDNIDNYSYNDSDSLHITSLPPTTYAYNNRKLKLYNKSDLENHIFVKLNFGMNNIDITEWEKKFLSPESALGIEYGVNLGYEFSKSISFSLGYEHGSYVTTIQGDLKSSFSTNYLYLSPIFFERFGTSYVVSLGAAIDVGCFFSKGNLYLYSYRNITYNDKRINVAVRPKLILHFPVFKDIMLDLESGYLLAESNRIDLPVKSLTEFPVVFRGFSIKLSVFYQFSNPF